MSFVEYDIDEATGEVVRFRSERLTGLRMRRSDADALLELHADPEVMVHIGGVRSPSATDSWLDHQLDHWDRRGYGQWMISVGDELVGRGGLRDIDACVGEELVEVGYVFARAAWGNGYATEATRAFIQIADRHHGLHELGAITTVRNVGSARVLERCGFVEERVVLLEDDPHRFFRLRM